MPYNRGRHLRWRLELGIDGVPLVLLEQSDNTICVTLALAANFGAVNLWAFSKGFELVNEMLTLRLVLDECLAKTAFHLESPPLVENRLLLP